MLQEKSLLISNYVRATMLGRVSYISIGQTHIKDETFASCLAQYVFVII